MTTHTLIGKDGSAAAALNLLRLRAARYQEVAHWIVLDTIWRFRQRLAWCLIASGLALGMQAGALVLFTSYARRLESNADFAFAGFAFDLADSYLLLVGAIGVGGVLFAVSSFLRLHAYRGFSELGGRYGVFCAERVITLVSSGLHGKISSSVKLDQVEVRQLVTRASPICSRVMYGLIGTLPLLAGLLVYAAFLVYLDFMLTMIILAAMSLSFVFYYTLSVQASTLMRAREEKKREMIQDYGQLLDLIRNGAQPLSSAHPLIQAKVQNGSFAEFFAQFFRPKLIAANSAHVSAMMQALVLTVIGLVKGGQIITTGTGFGDLIIFLVAGRMAMTNFLGITNALVMINRFYPTVADYFSTVERLQRAGGTGPVAKRGLACPKLRLVARPLGEGTAKRPPEIELAPGARLGLIAPRPIDRFTLVEIMSAFRIAPDKTRSARGRLAPGLCWLVPEAPAQAAVSFCEATGLAGAEDGPALRRELAGLGLSAEALAGLPADPTIPMDQAAWGRVTREALWGAHLLAAGRADRPVVIVGAEALAEIGEDAARNVFDRLLADRIVLIAYRPPQATEVGAFAERYALLYDDDTLLGYLARDEIEARLDLINEMDRARKEMDVGGLDDMILDDI